MGRSEELGTGIRNVFRYNKIYSNIEYNDFIEDDVFTTIVPLKIFTDNVTDNVTDKRLKQILHLITDNNTITTNKISNKLNVSKRTILRDIEKLKKQNKLTRVGNEKNGHWEIIK